MNGRSADQPHTSVMANGLKVGGDVEQALDSVGVPSYVLDTTGVVVLRLLEQGRSTKQIAAELHLSTETVRNHIRRLFRALGVNSRLEAVAAARAASPY